jgi:TolB protein
MTEIRDRFHDLDGLAVPDVYARARAMGPKEPQEPRPPAARRVGVILLAFLVAAAGFGLLLRARDMDGRTPATSTPTATPTGSAAPASHSLVAFATQSRGSTTGLVIAVMRPDGTGFRQLTGLSADHEADPQIARYSFASDDSPSFSPDGRTVAFVRRYAEGINSLCMIDVDGSNFRVVIQEAHAAELAWSPDGRTIAFYSEQDGGIHLVDVDGTSERTLWQRTGGPNQDFPSWSPDSSSVYYVAGKKVWVANADGSGSQVLADLPRFVGVVALSPDGSTIAFSEQEAAGNSSSSAIWLMDADGSNVRRVTDATNGGWYGVTWSPDGSHLLLGNDADGAGVFITTDGTSTGRLALPNGWSIAGLIAWSVQLP